MANTVELDFLLTKVMEWLGNHALKLKSWVLRLMHYRSSTIYHTNFRQKYQYL